MNRFFRATVLGLLLVAVAAPAVAGTWAIDPSHSVLDFKVRHLFSKTGGTFGEWEGTLEFDGTNPASLLANVTINAGSIDTGNEKRDGHLRSADFFSVEEHPTITFVSTGSAEREGQTYLVGDLTIRGTTKQVEIPFEFLGAGKDPWGRSVAGFSGSVTVDRTEFGLLWNKAIETGGVLLGDEVTIELQVEAVEQADAN